MQLVIPMPNNDKRLGYLLDECYLLHNPGRRHPESPNRLIAINKALKTFGAEERWEKVNSRPARLDDLGLVHHPSHLERIQAAVRHAPAYLDIDTVVSADSYRTALLATGGVLACVDSICSGRLRRVFAFVRPPGHHAGRNKAMGFCLSIM